MLKFVTKNPNLYRWSKSIRFLKPLLVFDLESLIKLKDEKLFIEIMDHIKLPNGTNKTTKKNRFTDVNELLIELLDKNKKYQIHDVAVSDGITSAELSEALKLKNIHNQYYISDKYSEFTLYKNGIAKQYFDKDGKKLFGSVLNIWADETLPWKYFITKLLGKININKNSSPQLITIFNPLTVQKLDAKDLNLIYFDILQKNNSNQKFDIIRCMNILNPRFFSTSELKFAINNVIDSLSPEGILIVGRTEMLTGINNVTFFKKNSSNNLVEINKINGGTEIRDLFDNL